MWKQLLRLAGLLKLTEEYLEKLFTEYKRGSQTIVGKNYIIVLPMKFLRYHVKDPDEVDE